MGTEGEPALKDGIARLGRERRFDEAWGLLERARQSAEPVDQATELLVAYLMRECERDEDALRIYRRHERDDIWAWVWRRKLQAIRESPPRSEGAETSAREALRGEIEERLAGSEDGADEAATLWLQAEFLTGLHLDDRVADEDLAEARSLLERARALVGDAAWLLPEIARVVRFQAARDEHHSAAMKRARETVDELRSDLESTGLEPTGESSVSMPLRSPSLGLDYERGRLALLNREWERAAGDFERVVAGDPSHQHAHVWGIYARRLRQSSGEDLLAEIDSLLDRSLSRDAVAAGRVPERIVYEDPYPIVCWSKLVAMLLAERAAILEPTCPAEALLNYELAYALRPTMLFAKRGRLRCLDASGAGSDAERVANELLEEARREKEADPVAAAELFVEIGRHWLARYELEPAVEHFDEAIETLPNYGYAYERKLVGLCMKDERELAAAEGERALAHEGGLRGESGVRIELANVMLELDKTEEALALYRDHIHDDTAAIRDRASAGCVHAHRYARKYGGAQGVIDAARARGDDSVGFRLWDASGRLACDLGDFSTALEHFERGLEQRPRERGLISGKARALRLLGRPTDSLEFLQQSQSTMGVFASEIDADIGWAELECGRPGEALAHFESAHERDRHDVLALRGIVVVESRRWPRFGSPMDRVARLLSRFGEQDYAAGGMLTELGCRCAAQGAFADARALFDEANKRSSSTSQRITQMLAQGHTLVEAHALDEAESTIDALETLDGGAYRLEPNVRLLHARWHLVHGESDTAATIFAEIGTRCERSQLAVFGRAAAISRRGDTAGAARALEDLLARLQRERELLHEYWASNESVFAREMLVRTRLHISSDAGETPPRKGRTDLDLESDIDKRTRRECRSILRMEPRSSQAYIALAVLAARRGEIKQAQLDVAQAATVAPARAEPAREQGWIALLAHDHDKAKTALDAADRLDPHDSRLHLLRGHLHLQRKEQTDAIRALRKAVALDPSSPDCATALADALDCEGESEEALRTLSDALSRLPRRDTLRLRLACARINHAAAIGEKRHLRQRLLEEAANDATSALTLAHNLIDKAEVHYHTGVIYHAQGDRRTARRELKECLSLNPDHFQARRAQTMIEFEVDGGDDDLHARKWATRLGVAGIVLFVFLLVDLTLRATGVTTLIPQSMIGAAGIAALVSLLAAALIPRLTSLNVRGVGSITVTPSLEDSAKPVAEIPFGRLPLSTLSGPGTGQLSPITPDTAGLASS